MGMLLLLLLILLPVGLTASTLPAVVHRFGSLSAPLARDPSNCLWGEESGLEQYWLGAGNAAAGVDVALGAP